MLTSSLKISDALKENLQREGYLTINQILVSQLPEDKFSEGELQEIYGACILSLSHDASLPQIRSLSEIQGCSSTDGCTATPSKGLNELLDGGLYSGTWVEFTASDVAVTSEICCSLLAHAVTCELTEGPVAAVLYRGAWAFSSRLYDFLQHYVPAEANDDETDRLVRAWMGRIRTVRVDSWSDVVASLESLEQSVGGPERMRLRLIWIDGISQILVPINEMGSQRMIGAVASSIRHAAVNLNVPIVTTCHGTGPAADANCALELQVDTNACPLAMRSRTLQLCVPALGRQWSAFPSAQVALIPLPSNSAEPGGPSTYLAILTKAAGQQHAGCRRVLSVGESGVGDAEMTASEIVFR